MNTLHGEVRPLLKSCQALPDSNRHGCRAAVVFRPARGKMSRPLRCGRISAQEANRGGWRGLTWHMHCSLVGA